MKEPRRGSTRAKQITRLIKKIRHNQMKRMHNALFRANYIRNKILPEAQAFGKVLEERILPAFEVIEEEAECISDEEWKRLGQIYGEDADPGDLAEAAQEAGIDHYTMMKNLEQGIINLFAVAAYHLFEQQLYVIHRRELLSQAEENNAKFFTHEEVINRLNGYGIDLRNFQAWPKLQELRLITNTVKHADGWSASELKKLKPEMFSPRDPIFQKMPRLSPKTPLPVYQPLFGQDFYLTPEEFGHYVGSIIDFWQEIASVLESQGQELPSNP
jgi:hypothetical protein